VLGGGIHILVLVLALTLSVGLDSEWWWTISVQSAFNFMNFSGNICKAVQDLLLIKRPDIRPLAPLFPSEGEIKNLVPQTIRRPSYFIFIFTSLE